MASTSATSPFATLSATTKEPAVANNSSYNNKPASTSAFASSSLSAFAGSDNSPFGSLAAGSSTGFSAFSSAFPATGKPGGLTSFASPNVTSSFGDSKAKTQSLGVKSKALGAAQSDNEDSDNEQEEENNGNDTFVAEKTDERFVAQPGMYPTLQVSFGIE
jgi:Ran-binding protein 3